MVTNTEDFLMNLLHCGVLDLRLIDHVNYDWCDILDEDIPMELNSVMRRVVDFGIDQITTAVNDRICELEAIPNERERDKDEETELKALRSLSPEDDILSFHNYLDTYVWLENHADVYRTNLLDALDAFADGTGFEIIDK